MIYYFTPYDKDKNFLNAIHRCMSLLAPEDWGCIMDGDTMFLRSDFGHQIQRYVDAYPDTGLFTTYASRCHYQCQVRRGTNMMSTNLLYHKEMADKIYDELDGQVKEIDRRIAGHLMLIKKSTWDKIIEGVFERSVRKKILGVDTQISYELIAQGYKIRLMRGVYILHYCRLKEGFNYNAHLR